MPFTTISDRTLAFNRPLASATMRALRDNITHVYKGTQMQIHIPSVSSVFGSSFCRTTINNLVPSGATLLGVEVVGSPTAVGGSLVAFHANANNAGGINFNAVVNGENGRVTVNVIPVFGAGGGLST